MPSWWLLRSASSYLSLVAASGQLGGQPDLLERLRDDCHVEVLVSPGCGCGCPSRCTAARGSRGPLACSAAIATRTGPHAFLRPSLVVLGQVTALVEHRQAHHVEVHLDIANLLDLEDPPRCDPAPRAQRVEPEIGDGLLGIGIVLSGSSWNRPPSAQPCAARTCSKPLSKRVVNVTKVNDCYTSETRFMKPARWPSPPPWSQRASRSRHQPRRHHQATPSSPR